MTQGRSPVREIRSLGSARGAPGNGRPYRKRVEWQGINSGRPESRSRAGRSGEGSSSSGAACQLPSITSFCET